MHRYILEYYIKCICLYFLYFMVVCCRSIKKYSGIDNLKIQKDIHDVNKGLQAHIILCDSNICSFDITKAVFELFQYHEYVSIRWIYAWGINIVHDEEKRETLIYAYTISLLYIHLSLKLNSTKLSDTYMRGRTRSSWFQRIIWHKTGNNSLPISMLIYSQSAP